MIIDATNLIMGRLAAFAAKKALIGEKVDIINCEKAIVTGARKDIVAKYHRQRDRGGPFHGPFISRKPNLLLKHVIRGMVPHKQAKGIEAMARIKCYIGTPKEFEGKKTEKLEKSGVEKLETTKYITVQELSFGLGAR
ncbi:MAG: 50S ribosomal protein L13 [Nanoarchaeota archaeon]|nr:50S ribosomal protein L13 [Nanoarchaeota archaeon]